MNQDISNQLSNLQTINKNLMIEKSAVDQSFVEQLQTNFNQKVKIITLQNDLQEAQNALDAANKQIQALQGQSQPPASNDQNTDSNAGQA